MKAFVISDNVDTYMGMRLAGFDCVVVHQKEEVLDALQQCLTDDSLACVLMTTKIVEMIPDVISEYKLHLKKPLLCEIPDRHGNSKIGETIDAYISEAIGVKL